MKKKRIFALLSAVLLSAAALHAFPVFAAGDTTVHLVTNGSLPYFTGAAVDLSDPNNDMYFVLQHTRGDTFLNSFGIGFSAFQGDGLTFPIAAGEETDDWKLSYSLTGYETQSEELDITKAIQGKSGQDVTIEVETPVLITGTVTISAAPGDHIFITPKNDLNNTDRMKHYQAVTGNAKTDITDTTYGALDCADFVMPESGVVTLQLAFDDYAVVDTTTQKAEEFLVSEMGDAKSISFSEENSSVLYGDVDLDGRIDVVDAVLLNKAASGSITLNPQALKNADCNADGELGTEDALVLMRFLVHLTTSLPE